MLHAFSPAVREWFATSFPEPTAPQVQGWPAIVGGAHTLICAPTGSGKTLTAFLSSLDRLITTEPPPAKQRTRVLYVSPLRALAFDVEKNLRAPLAGISLAAERLGVPFNEPVVAMRTGDTSAKDRQALARRPPDLLITTPESLYLMLTSAVRDTLVNVDTVIIDEIHALAPTKRGSHLMLTLERLEEITVRPPQRIGLSATQRPLEEVARFLGGQTPVDDAQGSAGMQPRPVTIVDTGVRKTLNIDVVVPVEDMGDLGRESPPGELHSGPATAALAPRRTSIWPSIYPKVLDQILDHRSTIIFCNARRAAERLAAHLNELAQERGIGVDPETGAVREELVKAHHGSLAREQRVLIEDQLKRGTLRAIVATSSLELGIDMGAVDLVIQVESPGAVSRGLQRIGRAGHTVGEPSNGTIYPKHRHDLLESAVVTRHMLDGRIESTRYLRNPLDVLAQQIVAHAAVSGDVPVTSLASMVRRSAAFADLPDEVLHNVLDLLSGRYPSEEFSELRPRIVWDRIAGTIRARDGAQRLAVTNGGTIPDRGLFGVFLPDGTRVGELDEEMVYESRPGETFLLGASTWRIEDITFERVIVTPAPGQPGKMPFWHGDMMGRPVELGRALGEFVRSTRAMDDAAAVDVLRREHMLDELAATNLVAYLSEQAESTGVVPDDRTVVVERFRDEIGDWRVCIHTPFGTPVHAPWAMAIQTRFLEQHGLHVETMWGDDGIVLRLPEAADSIDPNDFVMDPETVHETVVGALPQTSMFAARFRECAARALLLPRRRPGERTPLWQQRQRAADLLAVAAKYPTFPMLLETSRECLQDVFDVPALCEVLGRIRSRGIRLVHVDTPKASPFAQSLMFNWIAAYMYEGDAPLAERRAAALSLDRDLLNSLLGAEELRELLDPEVLASVEFELQCITDGRRARSADELHDVLRRVGHLSRGEIAVRAEGDASSWVEDLVHDRRAFLTRLRDEEVVVAAEDAALYRDALGCGLPLGLPAAFTDPRPAPLGHLVARFARTHGPFLTSQAADRFGTTRERIAGALAGLESDGRVVRGEFRPGGTEREWCDVDVLRQLRRRSLAALRREVEPVEQAALARFLPAWHAITAPQRGTDALVGAVNVLQGAALVASSLETDVLPLRVRGYRQSDLDALCATGEVVWVGAGALGSSDGRIRLFFADQLALLAPAIEFPEPPQGDVHDALRMSLQQRGALFFSQLRAAAPQATDSEVLAALWDLVWAGEVTNDTLAPLRAMLSGGGRAGATSRTAGRTGRPRPGRLTRIGPPTGAGRWSLVAPLLLPAPRPTESSHALALQMLERHGVVTREAVLAEGPVGGFAAVYGVLKTMEERGQVRRGYFINGLGAAQFALPGAVDRLRDARDGVDAELHPESVPTPVVLAATDPAQPHGATVPWPLTTGRPTRSAGAVVVLADGEVLAWFDPRAHHLVTFPHTRERASWVDALVSLVKDGRRRSLEVRKIDGESPSSDDPVTDILRRGGFVDGYRGLTLRD
ncbi:MAG: DEAD/DEAH box helicase [Actinobacteria bacterium]|nr:DEAD/DEAH box helicase [Actinomycetota bacterium]